MLNEKNVHAKQKSLLYAGPGSKQETFLVTTKQLIRKNPICCLTNHTLFFHRANIQISFTTHTCPSLLLFAF